MRTSSIIMAGGNGTRFWPKSRNNMPKQFLDLDGQGTLLNQTIKRLEAITNADSTFIVGNSNHKNLFDQTLPNDYPHNNVMLEPFPRNTAPAVAASVMALHKKFGNHVVVVVPSDQHIKDTQSFRRQIKLAIKAAKQSESVITLGIKPTFPSTGYGYLYAKNEVNGIAQLESFVEKPDEETAEKYIQNTNYFWNAGIFVFQSKVILKQVQIHMPVLYKLCNYIDDWHEDYNSGKLNILYQDMPSESIDYGIMEKVDNILMVPLDCGWSDLGSWDALSNIKIENEQHNIIEGNVIDLETHGSTIVGNGKLIAVVGLKDIIIVDTEDALLICNKKDVQKIKGIVSTLKERGQIALI